MLIADLMRKIGSEPLPPVLLFAPGKAPFGRDPFEPMLADKAVDRILATTVDPSMRDLAYTVYYADEVSPGEVAAEANTLPFLCESRVILVRNADRYFAMSAEKNSPLNPLNQYLASPNPATLLLLLSPKADKRKRFYKLCEEAGAVVECPQLDDREISKWVSHEAELRGKHINHGAVQQLVHRAGARLSDTANALDLVCNFVGERTAITEEDVRMACADVAEETVFALTDAIAASNTAKALETLHQLTALGKAPDELIGIINWMLENAYKSAPESKAPAPKPFVANKVIALVKKFGFAKLTEALALCTETHFRMRSTGSNPMLEIEMLVIKLAVARRRA